MKVGEIIVGLEKAEKRIEKASANLQAIKKQLATTDRRTLSEDFWTSIQKEKLYDGEIYELLTPLKGKMDDFMEVLFTGFFNREQVEKVFDAWDKSIEKFIKQEKEKVDALRDQLKEKYDEYLSKNTELKFQSTDFYSLLRFLMS